MSTTKADYLREHEPFARKYVPVAITNVLPGDVVRFMYEGKRKMVMVLNPDWKQKLHAVSLIAMPRASFLKVFKDSKVLDEFKLYEQDLKKNQFHAYRTYFLNKIKSAQLVEYVE